MEFSVYIVDNFTQIPLIEDAKTNVIGLMMFLRLLTNLEDDPVQNFIHSLRANGERTYCGPNYTIFAKVKEQE